MQRQEVQPTQSVHNKESPSSEESPAFCSRGQPRHWSVECRGSPSSQCSMRTGTLEFPYRKAGPLPPRPEAVTATTFDCLVFAQATFLCTVTVQTDCNHSQTRHHHTAINQSVLMSTTCSWCISFGIRLKKTCCNCLFSGYEIIIILSLYNFCNYQLEPLQAQTGW